MCLEDSQVQMSAVSPAQCQADMSLPLVNKLVSPFGEHFMWAAASFIEELGSGPWDTEHKLHICQIFVTAIKTLIKLRAMAKNAYGKPN